MSRADAMHVPFYQVDSFADSVFVGNPAGVCVLEAWLPDATMRDIAAENNLSETAFIVKGAEPGQYDIRWFTPVCEVDLCGHATLAAAYVVFLRGGDEGTDAVSFGSKSGPLAVKRKSGGWLEMNFPVWPYEEIEAPLYDIGVGAESVLRATDTMFVLEDEKAVRAYEPDFQRLAAVPSRCVIITAPSDGGEDDFVSRVFCPNVGVAEDPVTGSAHCMLVPYWAKRLGKDCVTGYQASGRGGRLRCREQDGRVFIEGKASLYLEGTIFIPA